MDVTSSVGGDDAERLGAPDVLAAPLTLTRPLRERESVDEGDSVAPVEALGNGVMLALLLSALDDEPCTETVLCGLRDAVSVPVGLKEIVAVDDGEDAAEYDVPPLRVYAADAHAEEVDDGVDVLAPLTLSVPLRAELAVGEEDESDDTVALADGLVDVVICDGDDDALIDADLVAPAAPREGVNAALALPLGENGGERDASRVALTETVDETAPVAVCDELWVTDERPVTLPHELDCAVRDCAALSIEDGDAKLAVAMTVEDADCLGDRDADVLPLARTLRDELVEGSAEPDMDALADARSDTDAEPESSGDDEETTDCVFEEVAKDERDGIAVPETVAVTVSIAVAADETDCVNVFALLFDVVEDADSRRVARGDADDDDDAADETDGCADMDDEDESALLTDAPLLVDALAVAALEGDTVCVTVVDIDTVLTRVAAGVDERRGETVEHVESEGATERVAVERALCEGLDDDTCDGVTSALRETGPDAVTGWVIDAVCERVLVGDAVLENDVDELVDAVDTTVPENWLENVRLSVGIVGYGENVAVDDADVDDVELATSDS